MILYGSVTRGAGSHSWKEAFFTLRLVPSSIPRASGFGLTAYGGYLSSSQCQKSKLVSVTFLPPCQMWASGWGTPLMAGGTSDPPHASPWVLLGEHGYTRDRAGILAFPKSNPCQPPNSGPAVQPSTKSWEWAAFHLITQKEPCILQ